MLLSFDSFLVDLEETLADPLPLVDPLLDPLSSESTGANDGALVRLPLKDLLVGEDVARPDEVVGTEVPCLEVGFPPAGNNDGGEGAETFGEAVGLDCCESPTGASVISGASVALGAFVPFVGVCVGLLVGASVGFGSFVLGALVGASVILVGAAVG